jgi:hypothetical protein
LDTSPAVGVAVAQQSWALIVKVKITWRWHVSLNGLLL